MWNKNYVLTRVLGLLIVSTLFGCQTATPPVDSIAEQKASVEAPPSAAQKPPEPKVDPREAQYAYALDLAREGQHEQALPVFASLSEPEPFRHSLTNLGLLQLRAGDNNTASTTLQRAIEHDNEDSVAWNHLGYLRRLEGKFDAAQAAYEKSLEIDPEYPAALLNFGILNDIYLQRLPEALALYQRFLELQPDDDTVKKWVIDLERRIK